MRPPVVACLILTLIAGGVANGRAQNRGGDKPLDKIDKMRIIGTPVLNSAPRGIHVWLEDGQYHVAAVTALPLSTKKRLTRTFRVKVRSTKKISDIELGEWKAPERADEELELKIVVGPDPKIARFKTTGDLTITEADSIGEGGSLPIFVGPTARRGAGTIKIGKF